MRKFLLITIILLLTTACASNNLKKLSYQELNKKITNKETFVLCLTDEGDMGKTLKKTASKVSLNNNIPIYYLDTENLKADDSKKLSELFTYQEANIVIFVKEGIENSTLARITDPFISETDFKEELVNQGYIK